MYRFVRCQTHPKCPNLIGWYLVIEQGDIDVLMKLHRGVATMYLQQFGGDPHLLNSELASLYHPVMLAAKWLNTVMQETFNRPILVNFKGGWMTFDGVLVLGEITSDKLIWPKQFDDEVITIGKYPDGRHYYLSSNRGRLFAPPKHTTYQAAAQVAKQYTDQIRERNYLGDSR
jgi:hypothetical protein